MANTESKNVVKTKVKPDVKAAPRLKAESKVSAAQLGSSKPGLVTQILKVPTTYTYGTGRRKSAIAKVWLFKGTGEVQVNGMTAMGFFKHELLVQTAVKPLATLGLTDKYDLKMSTVGGGIVGQADACLLGVARALLQLNEAFKPALKENGFLTRDPRVKERKKYGRKRARKGYQFRKR